MNTTKLFILNVAIPLLAWALCGMVIVALTGAALIHLAMAVTFAEWTEAARMVAAIIICVLGVFGFCAGVSAYVETHDERGNGIYIGDDEDDEDDGGKITTPAE